MDKAPAANSRLLVMESSPWSCTGEGLLAEHCFAASVPTLQLSTLCSPVPHHQGEDAMQTSGLTALITLSPGLQQGSTAQCKHATSCWSHGARVAAAVHPFLPRLRGTQCSVLAARVCVWQLLSLLGSRGLRGGLISTSKVNYGMLAGH